MKTAITISFLVGIVIGGSALFLALYEPKPEIGLQKAQGCVVDGYVKHADGTVTNNWVCFDPLADSFEAPTGKSVPFRNYEQKAVYETSE